MNDQLKIEKWEGKVSADLSTNEIQAWSLLSDFFSLHLWLPGICTCEKVTESESGSLPGSVRYVAGAANESGEVAWAKEELIRFDSTERSFSYRVLDSNMGFGEYVAHFRVLPGIEDGCSLEWSFECEPVSGWTREDLIGYMDSGLRGMAERVEKTINPDGKVINHEANDKFHDKVNANTNLKAHDEINGETNGVTCEANGA